MPPINATAESAILSPMLTAQIVIGRFALVLLYGALIGIEREARHKNAGIKTNALVAIGAAGFAMITDTFGPGNHNPAQIAAMVVTGIGFIGAGVIIHRDGGVHGVTTAATLWANAAVGVTVGTGHLLVGTTIFVAILFTQTVMRSVERIVARRSPPPQEVQITIESSSDAIAAISEVWKRWSEMNAIVASRLSTERRRTGATWTVTFSAPARVDTSKLEQEIGAIRDVGLVAKQQTPAENPEP
ncbi:MAG: MgtC/SapB family protein [Thermoanaerobaculia bacterium]